MVDDLEQVGRAELIGMVRHLQAQRDAYLSRCTELLIENRKLREGLVLPGWFCRACGVFTGTAKEELTKCRSCEAPR